YQMVPATAGTITAGRTAQSTDSAVEVSQQSVGRDLKGDGSSHVLLCPNGIGVHHDRRFVMVAWGGADGWSGNRIHSPPPINSARAGEGAALKHYGRPDIVVLGGPRWRPQQPEGQILRIYWGAPSGYGITDYTDLGVPSSIALAAGDFDSDSATDLALLRTDGKLTLFWSTKSESSK